MQSRLRAPLNAQAPRHTTAKTGRKLPASVPGTCLVDFVLIETSSGNSTLKVDRDGVGTTYSFVQVATLQSVTGLTDEAALVASGNLLVA